MKKLFLTVIVTVYMCTIQVFADSCINCHSKTQSHIIADWKLSKHSENDVSCSTCHGENHTTNDDFAYAQIPTPDICADCHESQVEQFKKGKHAPLASLNAPQSDYPLQKGTSVV